MQLQCELLLAFTTVQYSIRRQQRYIATCFLDFPPSTSFYPMATQRIFRAIALLVYVLITSYMVCQCVSYLLFSALIARAQTTLYYFSLYNMAVAQWGRFPGLIQYVESLLNLNGRMEMKGPHDPCLPLMLWRIQFCTLCLATIETAGAIIISRRCVLHTT